jgi:hypothetical protein
MRLGRRITVLLLCSAILFLFSWLACHEGSAYDQSGCVLDLSLPPPVLGFEYWGESGIMLGVFGMGLVVAVFLSVRNSADDEDSEAPVR